MAFEIIEACGAAQVQQVRALLRDYVAQDLVDLSSQNIDAEIAGLPGRYAAPSGTLLLATDRDGTPAGCVAIHKFGDIGDAEMKRLFVAPTYRGLGLGKDSPQKRSTEPQRWVSQGSCSTPCLI